MLLRDNRAAIRTFLANELTPECDNKEFYKFDALVRKKDNPENIFIKNHKSSFLVHSWLVSSLEQYDKYIDEMVALCELTGARLYMTLDRKSTDKTAMTLSDYGNNLLKSIARKNTISTKNMYRVMDSLTSKNEVSIHKSRKLLFDIDSTDERKKDLVVNYLLFKQCDAGAVYAFPTLNGYHVISKRVDILALPEEITQDECIDLKYNAMTLVYFRGNKCEN